MMNASYNEFKLAFTEIFEKRILLVQNYKKIFFIGLIVRLFFAPWTGHPYDLPIWLDSGEKLANGLSPYTSYIHLGQTILWAVWTAFSYKLSEQFFQTNLFATIFFIKLLPIFSDLLLPIELIQLINKYSGKNISINDEKLILMTIWLNPYFIIVSSWWAQIDNLAFLLIIFSFELILQNKIFIPILLTTISISLKLYPVIFLPPLALILCFRSRSIVKSIIFVIAVVILFFLVAYGPFYLFHWNTQQMTGVLTSQLTRDIGGITLFGVITNFTVGNSFSNFFLFIFDIVNSNWYYNYIWLIPSIFLTIYYFFMYRKTIQKTKVNQNIIKNEIFLLGINMLIYYYIAWFLTAKWVSEQNLIPFLCLLILKYLAFEDNLKFQNKLRNYFIILNSLILLYLIFNTPLFSFFYLLIDTRSLAYQLYGYQLIRSIFLVLSTVGVILYSVNVLRAIYHGKLTLQRKF